MSDALKKAQQKYEGKRSKHRLPSIYLKPDEEYIWQMALKKSGDTKKATIIKALINYIT